MTRAATPEPPTPARRRAPLVVRCADALGRALVYWMPVWIPLVLLGQVALRGLRPALTEHRRLVGCEASLEARLEEHLDRRGELEALHQALADPIYVERLRLERRGE
jgi:hypothetical protein